MVWQDEGCSKLKKRWLGVGSYTNWKVSSMGHVIKDVSTDPTIKSEALCRAWRHLHVFGRALRIVNAFHGCWNYFNEAIPMSVVAVRVSVYSI